MGLERWLGCGTPDCHAPSSGSILNTEYLGAAVHSHNPSTREVKEEDRRVNAILCYIESSKPVWAT